VLSIDLSNYLTSSAITTLLASKISTSHEANNLAVADVDHSGFGLTVESFTLKTPQGVVTVLSSDNAGNLYIDSQSHSNAAIITMPYITPLLANKANSSQVLTNVPLNALFTDTLYTHPSQHSMSMITGLTAALAGKQNNLTATLPMQLSGAVISSLWRPSNLSVGAGMLLLSSDTLGTAVIALTGLESRQALKLSDPSGAIRELTASNAGLLLWNGATFALDASVTAAFSGVNVELSQKQEALSVTDGLVLVGGALGCPVISELQDSIGLSLGTDNGSTGYDRCRMAIYEDSLSTHHHWYGTALYSSATGAGLGLWGSSGYAVIDQGSGVGTPPPLFIKNGGNIGINQISPTERLHVGGNIRCSGSLTASSLATNTKNFDIPNEGKGKENWRCRHWCVEGDTPGGSLIYKRQVTAQKAGLIDIVMTT